MLRAAANHDPAQRAAAAAAPGQAGKGPPICKKKKSQYGNKRKKNSTTRREYDLAMANNNPALDPDDQPAVAPAPAEVVVEVEVRPPKKPRSDDNWRTQRSVQSMKKKLEKEKVNREADQKEAKKKLAAQEKKTRAEQQKVDKEKKKTADAKEKLKEEQKLRKAAEEKVCSYDYAPFICPFANNIISPIIHLQAASATERAKEAEHQTWREKLVSRKLIDAAQKEVLDELEEAQLEMEKAIAEKKAEYEAKLKADDQHSKALREERRVWWEKMAKLKETAEATLVAESRGFEALIDHMKKKHAREMNRLNTRINDKDAEMMDLEEKHARDMKELELQLEQQKEVVHEEKQRRRRTEQKVTDVKAECQEHIKAMDLWIMEIGEELKVRTVVSI
jgi:hypothetical protein